MSSAPTLPDDARRAPGRSPAGPLPLGASADATAAPGVDILEPLAFTLRGSRLIEASAGTGKTFTIAALYLRLVLGHGGEAAFNRPLTPPEILVVTFTDAATKELRDRIRARLAEAADAFLAQPSQIEPQPPGRDLLHDLRATYTPAQWPACARTLRLAAEWMDEAAVSTIHGWCNRMLGEHAFDSGSLFTQTLETDQRELHDEVLRDYWRSFFVKLPLQDAQQVRAWWATPAELLASVDKLLNVAGQLPPGDAPATALARAREAAERERAALKAPWAGDTGWAAELLARLEAAVAAKHCKLPKRKDWMQALRDWAESDAPEPRLTKTAWERLRAAGLAEGWAGDADRLAALCDHAAWQALETLKADLKNLPDGRPELLQHAAHWAHARLATEQARRAQMGFDELLTRLDAALQGPNGERLAALIRRQFPVALIDEFQDTDPVQYRIFDTIYRVAANAQDTALVLIGDPKQAIYAFRGADIHTYLAARRDTGGRHATLGKNFRSSQAMVEAVNRLFMQAEQRQAGQGAFLFREPDGNNPLPFIPVQAQGRRDHWGAGLHEEPALTFWTMRTPQTVGIGDAQRQYSAACATQIVCLLNDGLAGRAGFFEPAKEPEPTQGRCEVAASTGSASKGNSRLGGALKPVQPGDIAVLVNSGREARAVREALHERGVRSVYLSDKDSVFQSPVAAELQRWLAACAEPDDDRPLRAALGSATFNLSWAELDRLNHDELQWEARVLQFRRYQQTWRRQGVLPMLRHLLNDFAVPQRLLAAADALGERTLTDLLHLAELLQQASAQLDGEHALIRWLAEQRQDASGNGGDSDGRKLRLESDAELVKVVTVHKSKGLEYPLVFLPFATAFRPAKPDDLPLKWHDDDGRLQVALQADAEALQRVDHERLGEDLRKLYVALTRARYATWVGAAPLANVERSALGYLFSGGDELSPQDLATSLAALVQGDPAIAVQHAPAASDERYHPPATQLQLAPEPALPTGPREPWWIASYSALRLATDTPDDEAALPWNEPDAPLTALPTPLAQPPSPAGPATAAEDTYAEASADEPLEAEDDPYTPSLPSAASTMFSTSDAGSLHAFPRGAGPGSFLHGLLEWVARQGFGRVAADASAQEDLADLIARRCNLSGWSHWTEPLRAWLLAWLETPLDLSALQPGSSPFAPAALGRVQVEMEFWFAAERVDTRALDALVTQHTLAAAPRPPLQPQQLNGMLKGFIDLVFEHEGRYFVADYKSNWLGPADADYHPAALRGAVLQHRYELQYVLYVFALHRLLRVRLPDYDYERHIGGAVYLFLRGHAAASQGLHCERPPRVLINALDALFSGAQATP